MVITCPRCVDGVADGAVCVYCGGDGEIDLLDSKFRELAEADFRALTGQVWSEMVDKADANTADIAAVKAKTDTITSNPSGVFDAYQVIDVMDTSEWSALSDGNKTALGLIVSCGMVNLNDGSVKTVLWGMFDSESTTRANFITLIG